MKQPSPSPCEVEKTIEKFLEQLHNESLENYSMIRRNLIKNFNATDGDDDYVYDDYDTPSPIDEEPYYDDEEEYLLCKSRNPLQQQN